MASVVDSVSVRDSCVSVFCFSSVNLELVLIFISILHDISTQTNRIVANRKAVNRNNIGFTVLYSFFIEKGIPKACDIWMPFVFIG